MNCPTCQDEIKMYEIPEAEPPLLRCPNCMTTIQKPEPKADPKGKGK